MMKSTPALVLFAIFMTFSNIAYADIPKAPNIIYGSTGTSLSVAWDDVAEATGYTLYYAPSPYTGPESVSSIDMGTATDITTQLEAGSALYVAVQAYNADGASDPSNIGHIVVDPLNPTDNPVPPPPAVVEQSIRRLAEAIPDECYVATEAVPGDDGSVTYSHPGGVPPQTPVLQDGQYICEDQTSPALPKTNEAYVWGLARADDRLWFGTGANVNCMVEGGYFGSFGGNFDPDERFVDGVGITQVCEFEGSWLLGTGAGKGLPGVLGDWRRPSINFHDLTTGTTHHHVEDEAFTGDPVSWARLSRTLGLRSAGSIGDLVFLAGPDFALNVNIFAFRSSTGEYLGSYVLDDYSNIRKWKVINGELYTALAATGENLNNSRYGHILKWVGTQEEPFVGPDGSAPFVVVGTLPGQGAELSEYGSDRMAVSTWPGGFDELASGGNLVLGELKHAGIYLSEPIPEGGLDPLAADENFTEVFTFADYDPDLARAFSYGGGALAYFDGHLIWGSMHVPLTAGLAMWQVYQPFGMIADDRECRQLIEADYDACPLKDWDDYVLLDGYPYGEDFIQWSSCVTDKYVKSSQDVKYELNVCMAELATFVEAAEQATISIFRGRNLEATDKEDRVIDVLYGFDNMLAYRFDSFFGLPQYGAGNWEVHPNGIGEPVFGEAGFGNQWNSYTWEMRIVNDRLFIGTLDITLDATNGLNSNAGFDLYSFSSARRAAVKEDDGGLGNPFNYGVRTMLPGKGNKLYIGTANPYNLLEDGRGGWELIEVDVQ